MLNARWLLPLLLSFQTLAGAATAQASDPLRSPACLQALDALQAEELAARASVAAGDRAQVDAPTTARILARRKFAAGTCLGAWMDAPPQASRAYQAPIRVAPVSGRIVGPPLVTAAPAASPLRPALKPTIIGCDVGGCFTSDGMRLPRAGGVLLSPLGVCSAQSPGQPCP
jgi:hypothetical protein